jgi:hypothetical protein
VIPGASTVIAKNSAGRCRFRRGGLGDLQPPCASLRPCAPRGLGLSIFHKRVRAAAAKSGLSRSKSCTAVPALGFFGSSCFHQRIRRRSGLKAQTQISPVRAGHGYVRTQPPEPLLKALLQRDCTANVPVERLMSAEAPCPEEIQAHLSPFSAPPESSQPPLGN